MSQKVMPDNGVIKELKQPQLNMAMAAMAVAKSSLPAGVSLASMPSAPVLPLLQPRNFTPPTEFSPTPAPLLTRLLNFLHRYSLAVFTLMFLVIGVVGIHVGGSYWSARMVSQAKPAVTLKVTVPTIAGLNLTVPAKDLQTKLQTIDNQPASLTVGDQTIPVGADTIKSWLQITSNTSKSEYYIRIRSGNISASLNQLANQFVKAPVNEVTVNEAGINQVVVAGRNGTALSNPDSLKTQTQQIAKTVMDGKGMQFTTPLQTVPFQAVTPCAFNKSLYVNLTTKQMYAYQGCQLVNTFAVSAGAPDTPTPIGEFQVYAKYTVQNMSGYNPDHTKYFQPNVPWVNYFDGADAVHGNYWRPASYFGNINSSHGCVGLPVDQAEWVYNWAPVGTTVITQA